MKFDETAYSALLERIFSITPSVQTAGFNADSYKPGLDGMRAFDERLGHPWKQYRCIHVAGTNGKGSVASMIASALACSGSSGRQDIMREADLRGNAPCRVGLYTSPHLVDFRERMKVVTDSGWIMPSKEEVWEFFQEYLTGPDGQLDTGGLSFFEMTTGLAFWWFARKGVDWAVVEAGLGGRLDSTNIITSELAVITSIGLDHCALLGSTRAAIAGEKAGIFKPGVPALVASEDDETAPVFEAAAAAGGSPLYFGTDLYSSSDEQELLPRLDLQGPCQRQNLHTALLALQILGADSSASSEAITRTAARTGLRGRWERVSAQPEVVCDIAHNPPALKINFARLRDIHAGGSDGQGRPLTIVYGIMADKDLAGIAPLMPEDARYILAAPAIPRALPAAELQARLAGLRPDLHTQNAPSVAAAVESALALASPKEFIYIGGSTFVVTEAIEFFNSRQK